MQVMTCLCCVARPSAPDSVIGAKGKTSISVSAYLCLHNLCAGILDTLHQSLCLCIWQVNAWLGLHKATQLPYQSWVADCHSTFREVRDNVTISVVHPDPMHSAQCLLVGVIRLVASTSSDSRVHQHTVCLSSGKIDIPGTVGEEL